MAEKRDLSESLGAIEGCDTEAIHLSGAIQGRGCLLFFDDKSFRIQGISSNTREFLQLDQNPIGAKLALLFDNKFFQSIERAVKTFPWKSHGRHFEYESLRQRYEGYLYKSEELFALELEKVSSTNSSVEIREGIDQHLEEFTDELRNLSTTEQVAQLVCKKVRSITGLDRVMMYQFVQPTWHGQVIAENRVIESHSFMGHRFPSSDIPKPARDLYLRNRVRWISDIDQPIYPIEPAKNPLTDKKFDLSDSRLRSVSPIHLNYLKNMGVKSSMSFAVTVKGVLWGLVACHHMSSIEITQEQRLACEFIVNAFAAQGPLLDELAAEKNQTQFLAEMQSFVYKLMKSEKPIETMIRNHHIVDELFDASGVAYVAKNKMDVAGITPLRADLKALSDKLLAKMDSEGKNILVTSNLSVDFPEIFNSWSADPELQKMVCGIVALRSPTFDDLFLLFRQELIKTITWGGDPVKQLDRKNFDGAMNPRTSFAAWKEIIRFSSRPWEKHQIDGVQTLKSFVFDGLMEQV